MTLLVNTVLAIVTVYAVHHAGWNGGYSRGYQDGWNKAHSKPELDRRKP
jgi:hypothetical protein